MNDTEELENLLQKTPRLKVPSGLREKLEAEIVLPRTVAREPLRQNSPPLLRRWLPALSFSAFLLACAIVIAVQSSLLSEVRRENARLRASSHNLDQLRQENLEYQKLLVDNQPLGRFRKDNLELQSLRNQVVQLRGELDSLAPLRAENLRLLAERKLAESRLPADAPREEDPFAAAQRKAQRIICVSNLKQIALAARLWSGDHKDTFPADFLSMSNELNSPKILRCPGDTNMSAALTWSRFGPANASYEILSPGVSDSDLAVVYVRCPVHNNVGMVDGSVQMFDPNVTRIIQKDGRWVIERIPPKAPSYE